jgi:hypothetical protein
MDADSHNPHRQEGLGEKIAKHIPGTEAHKEHKAEQEMMGGGRTGTY